MNKMQYYNKDLILNDLFFYLQFTHLDQQIIRQFSPFFEIIHWRLIACCQDLNDNLIKEFRKPYEELFKCDNFNAIKNKIISYRQITKIKNMTDD